MCIGGSQEDLVGLNYPKIAKKLSLREVKNVTGFQTFFQYLANLGQKNVATGSTKLPKRP